MATLLDLSSGIDGPLFKLEPGLDEDEQENRLFYASDKLRGWITDKLPTLESFFDDQDSCKERNLYEGYRNEVIHFRTTLPLDEPKFIDGTDPNDIISNCDFP